MAFQIAPLIYFLVISYGFGLFLTRKIKLNNIAEKIFLMPVFGLTFFVTIALFIRWSPLPLDWRIFLILSLIYPAWLIIKRLKNKEDRGRKKSLKISKAEIIDILVPSMIFLFIFSLFLMGSFRYPYLEDDDPWIHAGAMNYVAQFKTTGVERGNYFEKYLEPYPPGFLFLTGTLKQVSSETIWTLKFFNSLILALGYAGFYFVFRQILRKKEAIVALIALTVTPCFFGHFIWASSLAMLLFVPGFYSMFKLSKIEKNRLRNDRNYFVPFVISFFAMSITQMSNPFIFGILCVLYLMSLWISARKFPSMLFYALLITTVLSLSLFWFPMFCIHGIEETLAVNSININNIFGSINTVESGGGEIYNFRDFLISPIQNKIDNATGFGPVLFLMTLIGIPILIVQMITEKERKKDIMARNITLLLWFFFSLYGTLGNSLPGPDLMPHRFWSILAIPSAMIFAIATTWMFSLEIVKNQRYLFYSLLFILIVGIGWGSLYPKIYVQGFAIWPPGVHVLPQAPGTLTGYMALTQTTAKDSLIFGLCGGSEDKILAYDRKALPWDKEVQQMKREFYNKSVEEIKEFLDKKDFDYIAFDFYCVVENNSRAQLTVNKLNELKLPLVYNETGYFLFKA